MKLKILLLLFLLSSALYSQVIHLPEDYHFKNLNLKNYINQKSLIFSPPIVVNPINSKYPISNFITDIFVNGDTVWFATGSGIMRTISYFTSFQHYYGLEPFGKDDISGFCVRKNIIAVATATTRQVNEENIPVGTGIKISTDYGISWYAFDQPIDGLGDSVIQYGNNTLYALPVVVREQNLSYDIAITRNEFDTNNYVIWITSFAGGLRKTTNYGNTWQRVVLPPDNLDSIYIGGTGYNFALDVRQNLNHRVFTVEALNDSTLFVGTANGINKSTDWGKSWRKYNYFNSGSGTNRVSGNFVVNLHIQKFSNNSIVWAATRRAENPNEVNALSYSSNGGYNWAYTLKDYTPNGIASMNEIVYGLTNDGLWRAIYGTFDWIKAPTICDESTNDILRTSNFYCGNHISDTLYIGSDDGLLRTIETGNPWGGKWKIFRAIKEIDLSSDIKSYAAPNPFSPAYEIVRIFFKTGKPISKVTIKIFDIGMNPVRTVIQNATRTSPDELFTIWDGKNNQGFVVANGVYFYRIEIDDDKPIWGKILVLQ
ncbi:MAG: hypothetical protein N2490_01235 [Ignavibacteria bacterium]|nr:hypothetical protein [Ignavibacteria bacterium]